jgi:hypothetical protein
VAKDCQPSTFLVRIWPDASSAQNSIAAVSAQGSTVCVLMRRLNSSCRRSIALRAAAFFDSSAETSRQIRFLRELR